MARNPSFVTSFSYPKYSAHDDLFAPAALALYLQHPRSWPCARSLRVRGSTGAARKVSFRTLQAAIGLNIRGKPLHVKRLYEQASKLSEDLWIAIGSSDSPSVQI